MYVTVCVCVFLEQLKYIRSRDTVCLDEFTLSAAELVLHQLSSSAACEHTLKTKQRNLAGVSQIYNFYNVETFRMFLLLQKQSTETKIDERTHLYCPAGSSVDVHLWNMKLLSSFT